MKYEILFIVRPDLEENAIKDVSMFQNAIKYLTDIKSGRVVTVADIPNMFAKPLDVESFKKAIYI